MNKKMYKAEKERQVAYYNQHLANVAHNMGEFRGQHEYVLKREDCMCNLFKRIRKDVLRYFEKYRIIWWGENKQVQKPTGHLVSSQIHCLNHLFALRKDDKAIKTILSKVTGLAIKKILRSPLDKDGYLTFEFVYKNKTLLGEKHETRGAKCTSIDALVYALLDSGKKILVPIEWKYTETYSGAEANKESLKRYPQRILSSSNLKEWNDLYKEDPYYELMRQTLLAEQIIAQPDKKDLEAVDYVHIVIIPKQHTELRNAITDRYIPTLKDPSKFHIIDPQELLAPLEGNKKYAGLLDYLQTRYW
jgi:hypothetical protein